MLVLRVSETLVGAFHPTDAPLRSRGLVVSLELEVAVARLRRASSVPFSGEITAESLATAQPLEGLLRVRRRELECVLAFNDDRARPWELRGSARFRGHAWRHSITRLDAALVGPDGEARAELRLDWHRGLRRMLRGIRVAID